MALADNIFCYYHLDELVWVGTPDEVKDATVNNRNGVSLLDGTDTVAGGKINRGGYFDNFHFTKKSGVNLGLLPGLGPVLGAGFTTQFWINRENQASDQNLCGMEWNGLNKTKFNVVIDGNNSLVEMRIEDESGDRLWGYPWPPADSVPHSTWVHVVIVADPPNDSLIFYIDGSAWPAVQYDISEAPNNFANFEHDFYIGSANKPPDDPYRGLYGIIDEFTIWTRMLSAGEVTTLYNGGAGLLIPVPEMINQTADVVYSVYTPITGKISEVTYDYLSIPVKDAEVTYDYTNPVTKDAEIIYEYNYEVISDATIVYQIFNTSYWWLSQHLDDATYKFRVVSVDEVGNESIVKNVTQIIDSFPDSVTNVTAETVGGNKVKLTWTDPTDSDLVDILIYNNGGVKNDPPDFRTIVATVAAGVEEWASPVIGNGGWAFALRARDASSNIEKNTDRYKNWIPDDEPPNKPGWPAEEPDRDDVNTSDLYVKPIAGGGALFEWVYYSDGVRPLSDDFAVYTDSGTGTMDYVTPLFTENFVSGQSFYTETINSLVSVEAQTWKFVIRSRRNAGADEDANTDIYEVELDGKAPEPVNTLRSDSVL